MSLKVDRIASEIQKELSNIMLIEARDETLKHITITDCTVTNDLSFAKIYYTYMGTLDLKTVDKDLKEAAPYLRTVLASKIDVRHTPELRFIYDESIAYANNIENIIKDIHKKDNN